MKKRVFILRESRFQLKEINHFPENNFPSRFAYKPDKTIEIHVFHDKIKRV